MSNRPENTTQKSWPTLTIDFEEFESFLEHVDASDEEKREYIQQWWNLLVNFVDLGFGIHPVQQACGTPEDLSTLNLSELLGLKGSQPKKDFAKANQKGGAP